MDKARGTEVYSCPKHMVALPPAPRRVEGRDSAFTRPDQSIEPSNASTCITNENAKNPNAKGGS